MLRVAIALIIVSVASAQSTETKAHSALVHSVAFSPDGKWFATAGFDKTAKIFEHANGQLKEVRTLTGHTDPVYCVAFSPDSKTLATSSLDKTIRLWAVADGKPGPEIKGHTDAVSVVAFSPDGKTIASGSGSIDKSVRLWNVADGKEAKNLGAHNGAVYALAFSPDGKSLASSGGDNLVKVWDVPGLKLTKDLKGHELGVTGVVFTDDKTLVSVSQDRSIRVWDLGVVVKEPAKEPKKDEPKKEEPKKEAPKKEEPKKEATKKDEPKKDPTPVKDPHEKAKFGPTPDDLFAVAWGKESKSLATAGYAGNLSVWDLKENKPAFTTRIKSPCYSVTFAPDGKSLASGHDNGTVQFTKPTPAEKK